MYLLHVQVTKVLEMYFAAFLKIAIYLPHKYMLKRDSPTI